MFAALRRYFAGEKTQRSPKRMRAVVLRLELLEDRRTPATFVVNTLEDNPSQPPPPWPQLLSLRQAMTLANADPGSTITFASYLSGAVELESPLPEITADMSIGGPNLVTVMRDPGAALFRVFTITGAVEVGLSNLVIRGGNAVDGAGLFVPAGATANLYQGQSGATWLP